MKILKYLNLGLAFAIEICMIASLVYWGFYSGKSIFTKGLLGVGIPIVVMVLWGLFSAPNSQYRFIQPYRLAFELIIFMVAAFALYKTGKTNLALAFGALTVISEVAAFVWQQ